MLKQRQLAVNSSQKPATGAISPDSKYLAYRDQNGIYVKLIETGETQTIPEPDSSRKAPGLAGRYVVARLTSIEITCRRDTLLHLANDGDFQS